jgi:ABC-type bacteriocin/lantibiotic exporter with double-glycine peptidase domain
MVQIFAKNKVRTFWILFTLAMGPGGETLSAFAMAGALNAVIHKNMQLFMLDAFLALACFSVGWVGMYLGHALYAKTTQEFLHDARAAYVRTASQRYTPFAEVDVTSGLNATTNDLTLINQTSFAGYIGVYLTSINVVFATIGLIAFHWSLAGLALVLALLMMLVPKLAKPSLIKSTNAISNANAAYTHDFKNWMAGLNDLFWANSMAHPWRRIKPASQAIAATNVQQTRVSQLVSSIVMNQNMLSQTLMLLLAGILAIKGQLSFGAVASVGNLASQSLSALGAMATSLSLVNSGRSLLDRILEKTAQAEESTATQQPVVPHNSTLTGTGITVRFDDGRQISYPDFHVQSGEKLAILGASGSGKTTLLKVLAGAIKPATGQIQMGGLDIQQLSPAAIASFVDMVPQTPTIFNASVRENITLGHELPDADIEHILTEVNLGDRITALAQGIDGNIDQHAQLSGGEMQRLALSRVLARRKQILLVDEGTSALDARNARSFVELLLKMHDTTVLFVTHSADQTMLKEFDAVMNLTPETAV